MSIMNFQVLEQCTKYRPFGQQHGIQGEQTKRTVCYQNIVCQESESYIGIERFDGNCFLCKDMTMKPNQQKAIGFEPY